MPAKMESIRRAIVRKGNVSKEQSYRIAWAAYRKWKKRKKAA